MGRIFNKKVTLILVGIIIVSFMTVGFIHRLDKNVFRYERGIGIFYDDDGEIYPSVGHFKNVKLFQQQISLKGKERIVVDSDISAIAWIVHPKETLDIQYQAYTDSQFEVKEVGDEIQILAKAALRRRNPKNIRLIIHCPQSYQKDLSIVSNVGSIDLNGVYRQLDIQTDIASVDMEADAEKMIFESNIGSLDAKGAFGSVDLSSNMGSIDLNLKKMEGGKYKLETNMGSIDVVIPRDASVRLKAMTEIGEVTCDAQMDGGIHRNGMVNKQISAQNRLGEATLDIYANAGSIVIKN